MKHLLQSQASLLELNISQRILDFVNASHKTIQTWCSKKDFIPSSDFINGMESTGYR